jgi:choline dehydrogenase
MRHTGGNPLYETFIEAALQAGHPASTDLNRGAQEGVGRLSVNIGGGRRQSASQVYLAPARARRNLQVVTHACVHQVRLEGTRAVGVSARVRGTATQFRADHVVLCGGAVNSPHLLLLSGIGAPQELERQGIAVRHALPGVGHNLQDHVCVRLAYESREPITLHSLARLDRAVVGFLDAWLRGSGPAATTPFGAGFLLRSDPAEPEPDLEGVFLPVLTTAGLWAPFILPAASGHGFVGTVYGLRPESRGRITLRSPDPRHRPVILANYLSTARDRATLRRGVRLLREVFAQRAFDRYRGRALFTSRDDDASLDAAIAESATSAYHPVGSCRMGRWSMRLCVCTVSTASAWPMRP